MAEQAFLAVDLGASSGRVLAGRWNGTTLALDEVSRFENTPVATLGRLQWNLLGLWKSIGDGIRKAKEVAPGAVSIGVDTWGVDYGLVGPGDVLLGNPFHYRDSRTEGMLEAASKFVGREAIFSQTGIQMMGINTLYQLYAMRQKQPRILDLAERFMMMPDLFHWYLTGEKTNEFSNATTTQCYDTSGRRWAKPLLERLGIPLRMFGEPVPPGTRLGHVRLEVADDSGFPNLEVVVPATHDTASAVLAVPAEGRFGDAPDWCYISSGTWSLMGVEISQPIVTPECLEAGFTNEGGVGGTTRLLKNITGLWIAQECRRTWARQGQELSWDELARMGAAARGLESFIDPDHTCFQAPGDMPKAIRDYCQQTGQPVPADIGSVMRCAIESLALKYRVVLDRLERFIRRRIETIHVVGGGVQNTTLCQATADACGRRVVAGPAEATAIGNVLMQAVAMHAIGTVAEARQIVRTSFPVVVYEPQDTAAWDGAYQRFLGVLGQG